MNKGLGWILLVTLAAASATAGEVILEGVGYFDAAMPYSEVTGISDDGSVVIGHSQTSDGHVAFAYVDGEMIDLGYLRAGFPFSRALAVNGDGSVFVGESGSTAGMAPVKWTLVDGQVRLSLLTSPSIAGAATGISADGGWVVGRIFSAAGSEAVLWRRGHDLLLLGDLPGGPFWSYATAVSDDGEVVIGFSLTDLGMAAFRWSKGVMKELDGLPGGQVYSRATSMLADGQTAIGFASSSNGFQAVRWFEDGAVEGLCELEGGYESWAHDLSATGIVVGWSQSPEGPKATIWTATHGPRRLEDVLVKQFGVDLGGWRLTVARAISADGNVFVGDGINPDGHHEGWIVRLSGHALISPLAQNLNFTD